MKVSVIIPTYNSEKTIRKTINSVYDQIGLNTLFDIELIIADDCSNDDTVEICYEYLKYGDKLIVNTQNSGGPNWGRNKGIKMATGDVVCFLDHDNEWLPNKIKEQLRYIELGYEVVYFNLVSKFISRQDVYYAMKSYDHSIAWPGMNSLMIINKNIPLFDTVFTDFKWLLSLVKNRKCIETPCYYRYNGGNLSKQDNYINVIFDEYLQNVYYYAKPKVYQSKAKLMYKQGKYKESRECFKNAPKTIKNKLYYITSFFPFISKIIVKKHKVYGH